MTTPREGSQNARILAVLADGKPKTVPTIHRRAGSCRLNSRVAELRSYGYDIVCERLPHRKGASAYRYTWIGAPGIPEVEDDGFTLSPDDWAPRTPEQRYRIYRVSADALLELVATVGSPEAVGVALVTLGEEGEFPAGTCVGIGDTRGTPDQPMVWVLNPFNPRAGIYA